MRTINLPPPTASQCQAASSMTQPQPSWSAPHPVRWKRKAELTAPCLDAVPRKTQLGTALYAVTGRARRVSRSENRTCTPYIDQRLIVLNTPRVMQFTAWPWSQEFASGVCWLGSGIDRRRGKQCPESNH